VSEAYARTPSERNSKFPQSTHFVHRLSNILGYAILRSYEERCCVRLAAISFAIVVSAACGGPRSVELAVSADRNVLLITVDTLRGDALGCDGGAARTPNIDALARGGIRFSFAHAHAVLTLPSHASILTGRYPFENGYRENSGYRLTPGTPTLAALLKAQGFATGAFVGAFPLDARFGLTPGFDVYDGRFDDSGAGGGFVLPERPAAAVVARADAWIAGQRGRWFAWVHVYDPHAPYTPPPPFDREYAAQPYYGEVAAVDAALGPLLVAARSSARPTLVVLTGDHGEGLGEHGEATHGLFAYESTLHVPLIIADVGGVQTTHQAGTVDEAPVRHVDIVPTILDALRIAAPPALPGHSLRTRADREGGRTRPSYFEATMSMLDYGWAPLSGVLAGREKYIDLPIAEMYDLAADPHEARNLATDTDTASAERERTLRARLAQFAAPLPGAPARESSEATERLRSLGYVGGSAPAMRRYSERDDPKRLVDLDRRMHAAATFDNEGRLADAIAEYRAVLAVRHDMMAASRRLAFDRWRGGDAAGAIAALRDAERAGAPEPGEQVQLGTYLADAGRAAEAIALLQRAAAIQPDLDGLNALGLACSRAGRQADALAAFTRALAIDPASAMTLENIGAVQLDAGHLSEARDAFTRAIASDPDAATAHAALATTEFKSGDRAAAIDHWKRAVALQPANLDALYDLGLQLMREGRRSEARPYLDQFLRLAPPSAYAKEIRNVGALRR
jgi:arylsulfatase A-like enzyme/Flp pilus assembly protein TadD